jgi:hypothetical protein
LGFDLLFVGGQAVGEPQLVAHSDGSEGVNGGFGYNLGCDFGCDGGGGVFGSWRLVVAGAEKEYGGQSDGSEQGLLFHGVGTSCALFFEPCTCMLTFG